MSDEEIDDKFKELLERKGMVSNELYCMCQSDYNISLVNDKPIPIIELLGLPEFQAL